jgi:hypothetical protein
VCVSFFSFRRFYAFRPDHDLKDVHGGNSFMGRADSVKQHILHNGKTQFSPFLLIYFSIINLFSFSRKMQLLELRFWGPQRQRDRQLSQPQLLLTQNQEGIKETPKKTTLPLGSSPPPKTFLTSHSLCWIFLSNTFIQMYWTTHFKN